MSEQGKEIQVLLEEVAGKVAATEEGIALGLVMERVKELDTTTGEALEMAIGLLSRELMRHSFQAGVRYAHRRHPKSTPVALRRNFLGMMARKH